MRNEIKTHINPSVIPFAFHSLQFFVYHLSANFQSIWQYSHRNQLEPVSQNRLTDALCQSVFKFQLSAIDAHSLIARDTLFLSSASNYQKTVTNLSGRISSPHSSPLFLSIADDLIELKRVTDFSHLIPNPLFQGRKSTDFFFLSNSFIDKSERFFILASNSLWKQKAVFPDGNLSYHYGNVRFPPGAYWQKAMVFAQGVEFHKFSQEELHSLVGAGTSSLVSRLLSPIFLLCSMRDGRLLSVEESRASSPSLMPYVLFSVFSLTKACVNPPDPISLQSFSL